MVRWQASVLSLRSGDGIPVFMGQNKVWQKWQNLYNTMAVPMDFVWFGMEYMKIRV